MTNLRIDVGNEIRNGHALWRRMKPEDQMAMLHETRSVVEERSETDPDYALKLIACMTLANVMLRQRAAERLADLHISRNRAYFEAAVLVGVSFAVVLLNVL